MSNTEISNLWIASKLAGEKVRRNAHKLAWMDATRRMAADVIYFEPQLARYEADARKAAEDFSKAANGLSTEQIVKIITDAETILAAA